jgi:long-chain acyl-CoA synthetase
MNTIPSLFFQKSEIYKNKTLFGFKNNKKWDHITWNESKDMVINLSLGLDKIGIKKNDKVSIISDNSYQWCVADLAIMSLGGVTVPGYISSNEDELYHILSHSESSLIFTNAKLLHTILKIIPKLKKIKSIVCFDPFEEKNYSKQNIEILSFNELRKIGSNSVLKKDFLNLYVNKLKAEDVICLIYTSGTSSLPKGVMLTHKSIITNIEGAELLVRDINVKYHRFLSIIPLSHAYEHTAGFLLPLYIGADIYFNKNRDHIVDDLLTVKPTLMVAVPRLYEVLYKKINNQLLYQNKISQKLFLKAVELGIKKFQYSNLNLLEKLIDIFLTITVRKKIKNKFGGKLQTFISGGAALNIQVGLFFNALGINILQGYGQTECSPLISANPINRVKLDSVGLVIKGLEVKLSKENEILVKGNSVMKGYWKDEINTKKTIVNGWLHTGDLGSIDEDNYIKIIGRINEMIVNSGGENIAPVPIENSLLSYDEVEQVMVYGNNKPFLIAIIVPNDELIYKADGDIKSLHHIFQEILTSVNKKLSQNKKIRKFILTAKSFNFENNQLTPTLKIKRHIIIKDYKDKVSNLYKKHISKK